MNQSYIHVVVSPLPPTSSRADYNGYSSKERTVEDLPWFPGSGHGVGNILTYLDLHLCHNFFL